MILGIDAFNLSRGGGITHLVELLRTVDPNRYGFEKVVIWGGRNTLSRLEDRPWLQKVHEPLLDRGLLYRVVWHRFLEKRRANAVRCDIVFLPGGTASSGFGPVVTMSRNMLPFEWREIRRYGLSMTTLKLLLLRYSQSRSYHAADGVIFLTGYAHRRVLEVTGPIRGMTITIPHGLNNRFSMQPRPQQQIGSYSDVAPYRLLYVSIIDQYKHQWAVVEAVASLRQATGWPLTLDLVGPANPVALKRLQASQQRFDPSGSWARYHGPIQYDELHAIYAQADLGVFASSCENMPNILLETMGAGLPIACSDRGPMPEILRDAGVYFDPEQPAAINEALRRLIESPKLRNTLAQSSYQASQQYTWERCAADTFSFLAEISNKPSTRS